MRIWARIAFAATAPLLLASCLWGPGKFNSTLALGKGGTFVLDYKGEVLMQMPEEKDRPNRAAWSNDMATCYKNGRTESILDRMTVMVEPGEKIPNPTVSKSETRSCTKDEIAKLKSEYEKAGAEQDKKREEDREQMGKLFGLPGSDDASNRAFAARLMKYPGWKSVAYKGKGVFDVDYHFEGRTSQDFVFPLMPDSDLVLPFVAIRRRADGAVLVTAPALTGGSGPFGARAKAMGMPDKGDDGPQSRAQGRFTIVTDGEILTNNSEDGPVAHAKGRQVHWDVDPASAKVPEMLVRL